MHLPWLTWTGRKPLHRPVSPQHSSYYVQFLDLSLLQEFAKYSFRICWCCLTERAQVLAEPHFDSRSRIFELDSCGGNGKVCLVYKNCTAGVLVAFAKVLDGFLGTGRKIITKFGSFFRRCCPAERNLVPGPLAVLAFSDAVLHVLLQADGHSSGPTWVAVHLHPIWPQPPGKGNKVYYHL